MTYIEKLMSAIKFDDEMLTPGEIEMLRGVIRWPIEDNFCPAEFAFLKGPGTQKCPFLRAKEGCEGRCWNEEVASNE